MNNEVRNESQSSSYQPPRIERRISPADLEKEFAYAGTITQRA